MTFKEETREYLDKKEVFESSYRKFLFDEKTENLHFKLFSINSYDYIISHFLDCSNKIGYGVLPTNNILQCPLNQLAIGLLEGDDVICLDTVSNRINLWFIQTGNGEIIETEMSFDDFIKASTV